MYAPTVVLVPPTPLKIEMQVEPPQSLQNRMRPVSNAMRLDLDAQPRNSTDTGIDSIYSMYGDEHTPGKTRMSWAARTSAEHHYSSMSDRVRQSGVDNAASFSKVVTHSLPSNRRRSSICYETSALAYYTEPDPHENINTIPPPPPAASLKPLVLATAMVSVPNSPRISVATTSSAHGSTRAYSDLFEDSRGGRNGSNFRSSDVSSSSNTTPAITHSKEFRSSSPHSKHSSHRSSTHTQPSISDLPPLPPSRRTTPSPSHDPSHRSPQKSVRLDDGKPLPPLQDSVQTPSSKVSLVPSEGEDMDGFHVRNTYAQLEASGVKGDGYEEGIERTRAKIGKSRQSQLQAHAALGDGMEKKRDLDSKEVQALQSVDRYGFFTISSHDRLIFLNSGPLLKKLSPVRAGPPAAPAEAQTVNALPPVQAHKKEASRISKWNDMLVPLKRQQGGNPEGWRIRRSKQSKFRERTYKGIPDRWRRAAWDFMMLRMAGVSQGGYESLVREYHEGLDKPSSYDVQIDLDVPRTISGHIMFRTRYGAGQRSLFHVLHSFSLHCSTCGYVQGMGPIAATLLCYFEPERVYASLVILHDAYHLHTVFNPGFPGMLEAIYVQERIMESTMPAVYVAFKRHMISTTAYATKWYITLFANSVPFQTQLRLWDAFLLEGYDVYVAVAVAIIWVYRDHITSTSANFETVLSLLSSFFVPEDEDTFMSWIGNLLGDKKMRANMARWRRDWKAHIASGRRGEDALL